LLEFFGVNEWDLVYNIYGLTKRYFDFDKLKINDKEINFLDQQIAYPYFISMFNTFEHY
jgi:hypothetical protein